MDRKEFIRVSGRWILFGLMIIMSGIFITRRRNGTGSSCMETLPCSQCKSFSGCNLPQAQSFRKNEKEKKL